MITEQYYLSHPNNLDRATIDTDLSPDEILEMVGRFASHSSRAGQIRGKIVYKINKYGDEVIELRHHFNNKLYWSSHD